MKALQMHYTSCRHGLSGQAGFQTRALSDGLRPEERRELERRGGYRPPRDAPSAPSAEELGRDFPVAFRGSLLESGRAALTRSCYTGRDYSGRWGNFFAHSLVLETDPAELPPVWPIDLYEWEGWTRNLTGDGESEAAPEPLPPVDLARVPPAESFRLADLAEFLREEPGRAELLARMGRAVLLSPESSRRVVIRATALDGLFWIAAVQKLFPPRQAWRMSFSTYQDDPRGCARVNATTGATDFRLDEADRKYRFYVFDLIDEVSSEVPEAEDDYPAVVARWLAECPERHEELTRFMELFSPQMPDSALTSTVDLFRFARGDEFSCSDQRFAEAVEVASKWTIPEGRRELLDNLARAACQNGLGGPSAYGTLVHFLVDAAQGGEEGASRRGFDVWWSFVWRSWSEDEETSERIEELWRAVEPAFADRPTEGAELLAAALLPSFSEGAASIPVTTVMLRIFLSSLGRAGESRPWSHATSRVLVDALGRAGALEPALLAVRSDGEGLVEVAYQLLDTGLDDRGGWDAEAGRQFQREVGRALGSVLAHAPPAQASEVRARLAEDERWDVLFGEWLGLLEDARDLRDRYRAYRSQVLDAFPGYREARESEVAATLLDRLGRGDAQEQAAAWVEDGSLDRFGGDLAARCLALGNEAVPPIPAEAETERFDRLAEAIAMAADRWSIELDPDRPLLYRSLKELRARRVLDHDLRNRLGKAISRLSAAEASDYLDLALPQALERAENLNDHRSILAALVPRDTAEVAVKGYRSFIRSRKPRLSSPLKTALRFWLRFDQSDAETRHLEKLRKPAHDELVRMLAELPQRTRSRIPRKDIRHDISNEPASSRWEEIEKAVERRQRSPLRKLMNVFRGGERD